MTRWHRPGEDDFARFVNAYGSRLRRSAYLLTGDWAGADDLVQTAFERTWPRWSKLDTDARRVAYLDRVVFTSFVRGRKRRWTGEISTSDLPEPTSGPADDPALRVSLLAAMRTLPPQQRAVVTLRYLFDLSESDVADALGIGIGSVKSAASRGIAALRAMINQEDAR